MVIQPGGKGTVGPGQKVFLQANQRGGISAGGIGCVCALHLKRGGRKRDSSEIKKGTRLRFILRVASISSRHFPNERKWGKRKKCLKEILTPEKKKNASRKDHRGVGKINQGWVLLIFRWIKAAASIFHPFFFLPFLGDFAGKCLSSWNSNEYVTSSSLSQEMRN